MGESDSKPYGVVYCITNKVNGKRYVGQTVGSVATRWIKHCHKSSRCTALYSAIVKYGKSAFVIETIAFGSCADSLNALEHHYVCLYQSIAPSGYNLLEGGGSKGKWSEELRDSVKAKANTPERIARASKASVDMWRRDDVRERISAAIRVGLSGQEVRQKRSAIAKIACNTKEVKARMSVAQKIRFQDQIQCEAISTRQKALFKDPAYRERIANLANQAKARPEYRNKVSSSLKSLWANDQYREKMISAQRIRREREKLLKESQPTQI